MRPRAKTAQLGTLCGMTLLTCTIVALGCGAPVRVTRIDPAAAYREMTSNALSTNRPSTATEIVLRRFNLADRFEQEPAAALETLRDKLTSGPAPSDTLFALAELSFLYARDAHSRPHYLAAAVYALAFLFPAEGDRELSAIDARTRVAADLYNGAIREAFKSDDGSEVNVRAGTYALPFGELDLTFDSSNLWWGQRYLYGFVPASQFEVSGLRSDYRRSGIGAGLVARTAAPNDQAAQREIVGPKVRVPATLVLKIERPREQVSGTHLHGTLELYSALRADEARFDAMELPLESDYTTALGLTLVDAQPWRGELRGLLGTVLHIGTPTALGALSPHRRDRIPVVFVHGTASSPATWANTVNDLLSYRDFRDRFEVWFFWYNTGNPILYSSLLLRRALVRAVDQLDADGQDRCLRQMVVVGHSQGGLLTKMQVIDSGTRFWDVVSSTPFEQAKLAPKTRALLQDALFVKPLPFVPRVVFMSTPHRGSYLAGPQLVQRLAQRLIKLPGDLVKITGDLSGLRARDETQMSLVRIPTSIDNMSPRDPFVKTISTIPVAPTVAAHSIIAVAGDGPIETGGDGVVKYESAHVDGVESELVVRSGHSVQQTPEAVEELMRILMEHAGQAACAPNPTAAPAKATAHGE